MCCIPAHGATKPSIQIMERWRKKALRRAAMFSSPSQEKISTGDPGRARIAVWQMCILTAHCKRQSTAGQKVQEPNTSLDLSKPVLRQTLFIGSGSLCAVIKIPCHKGQLSGI